MENYESYFNQLVEEAEKTYQSFLKTEMNESDYQAFRSDMADLMIKLTNQIDTLDTIDPIFHRENKKDEIYDNQCSDIIYFLVDGEYKYLFPSIKFQNNKPKKETLCSSEA